MNNQKKSGNSSSLYIVQAGLVAALYLCLNLVSSAAGLAFGPVQIRISEALCLLPIFMPAAIPGLTVGCALSNISSPYGVVDIIIGSLSTLFAALLARKFRNIKWKNIPFLSALMPILFNAIFIGAEIAFLQPSDKTRLLTFLITMGQVALGEALAMILAVLLNKALQNRIKI